MVDEEEEEEEEGVVDEEEEEEEKEEEAIWAAVDSGNVSVRHTGVDVFLRLLRNLYIVDPSWCPSVPCM